MFFPKSYPEIFVQQYREIVQGSQLKVSKGENTSVISGRAVNVFPRTSRCQHYNELHGKELEASLEGSVLSNEKLSRLDMNELQGFKEKLEKLRDDVAAKMSNNAGPSISDRAGPSRPMDVDDVNEQLISDQINLANVRVVDEPSRVKGINLADVEASPIPADWLKL
ncbi:hypothetical protein CASFOL_021145 [Castilleja foliolosa]|uniref:Uncharacterized protein n=1 Tax=Castilleja foliolosa TaxID=1961234 RepID=A0ABD3CZ45_9LAMI